jgi:acid phosphatase type 7
MKHHLYLMLVALAVALTFGILAWILTLHGAVAMLRKDNLISGLFILTGCLGVLLIVLVIWRSRIAFQKMWLRRCLLIKIVLLTILGILVPATTFSYISGFPYTSTGNLPLLLLIQNNAPPISGTNLHFAASGDAHFGAGTNRPDLTARIIGQIADPAHGFDCFFSLGDLMGLGAKNAEWQEALTALSPVSSTLPTGFVAGNHDTLFNGIKNYRSLALPETGTSGDEPLYYRVDTGTVHFLVLDVEWSAETFDKQQSAWLESQLQSLPTGDWKIVLSHGYYYSSGFFYHGYQWSDNPETISAITPLFEKYGVDLVMSGHNHQMEYLQKNGITYVICGALGGKPDPSRTYTSPASLWYAIGQYGFADVSINGSQASIIFRGTAYQEIQTFTISK